MKGEDQDPHKLKKIAAAEYDYDNDLRWANYWSNVLIPPHMASRYDVITHIKRNFYQLIHRLAWAYGGQCLYSCSQFTNVEHKVFGENPVAHFTYCRSKVGHFGCWT